MPRGGDNVSHTAILAARERERTIVSLYARGANLSQIGRQLGLGESTVRMAFNRAVKRLPKTDVEALRKLQAERIHQMRLKVWTELSKGGDTAPSELPVTELIDRAIKIERHEALLFGLDAPAKQQVDYRNGGSAQAISDEELDIQLARLTDEERETYMRLTAKMQGRWVEPQVVIEDGTGSVETTATVVEGDK